MTVYDIFLCVGIGLLEQVRMYLHRAITIESESVSATAVKFNYDRLRIDKVLGN